MNENLKIFLITVAIFLISLCFGPIGITVFIYTFLTQIVPALMYNNTTSEKQKIEDAIKFNEESYAGMLKTNKQFSERLNLINEKNRLGIRLDYDDNVTLEFLHYYSLENIENKYQTEKEKINKRLMKLKENEK